MFWLTKVYSPSLITIIVLLYRHILFSSKNSLGIRHLKKKKLSMVKQFDITLHIAWIEYADSTLLYSWFLFWFSVFGKYSLATYPPLPFSSNTITCTILDLFTNLTHSLYFSVQWLWSLKDQYFLNQAIIFPTPLCVVKKNPTKSRESQKANSNVSVFSVYPSSPHS